jgi:hypothetical protein
MESTLKHEKGKEGYKAVLEYSWEILGKSRFVKNLNRKITKYEN